MYVAQVEVRCVAHEEQVERDAPTPEVGALSKARPKRVSSRAMPACGLLLVWGSSPVWLTTGWRSCRVETGVARRCCSSVRSESKYESK